MKVILTSLVSVMALASSAAIASEMAQESFWGPKTAVRGNAVVTVRGADVDVELEGETLSCRVSEWPVRGGRLQVECNQRADNQLRLPNLEDL